MPNARSNRTFFILIAASLSAAAFLVALLMTGNVTGPKVATNNAPSSQHANRQ
jgi:hypothetical protein